MHRKHMWKAERQGCAGNGGGTTGRPMKLEGSTVGETGEWELVRGL